MTQSLYIVYRQRISSCNNVIEDIIGVFFDDRKCDEFVEEETDNDSILKVRIVTSDILDFIKGK